MGILGVDSNKVKQSSVQQQVGVESGIGYGALSGVKAGGSVFGGGSAGNLALGTNVGAVRGSGTSNVSITNYDPSAALAALKSNQDLSTLSISLANTTATGALETLRYLQGGAIVAATPGASAETVGAAVTGATIGQQSQTQQTIKTGTLAIIGLIALGLVLYYNRRT